MSIITILYIDYKFVLFFHLTFITLQESGIVYIYLNIRKLRFSEEIKFVESCTK